MKNISLDTETLGTSPGSVILSIGACTFDEEGTHDEFYTVLSVADQLDCGATESEETQLWWAKQTPEARRVLDEARATPDATYQGLLDFKAWWMKVGGRHPWCRGAGFDAPLLEATFALFNLKAPWFFWDVRCERTLSAMFPTIQPAVNGAVAHHALSDALAQGRRASAILRHIRRVGSFHDAMDPPQRRNVGATFPKGDGFTSSLADEFRPKGLVTDAAAGSAEDLGATLARIRKEGQ